MNENIIIPDKNIIISNAFPLSVNYGRSVDDGVKAGHYNWAHLDINSKNLPITRHDTANIEIELIHLNKDVLFEQALRDIGEVNRRPIEFQETLAFGEKYPDTQLQFPIAALGYIFKNQHRYNFIICLDNRDGINRNLKLEWKDRILKKNYRFAVVPK